ncbi:fluoride efflux transporter FluC [Prochlorococcus marinus]|uniref:fluoride efflux transporter FluC n=1 Tax=Prochlorococcus marinus TaxID=1219 RepID=UPI0022B5DD10|nr:CrcB family protein [Prochlorococcus marinus]
MMKNNSFFFISIGAIPAAILRWQIDEIFIVNIIGCFLLGLINGSLISRKYQLLFGVGFCGSLTTFSGWSLYLFDLIRQGLYKLFILHSISIVIIGCCAVGLGDLLARKINS